MSGMLMLITLIILIIILLDHYVNEDKDDYFEIVNCNNKLQKRKKNKKLSLFKHNRNGNRHD